MYVCMYIITPCAQARGEVIMLGTYIQCHRLKGASSLPRPRMVAKGKPQPELLMAEMCNNLQVKIYYFNTAHSKLEMLLTIFVASRNF